MFLWRIAVDVLPTRENLSKRVEITDCKCILCGEEVDTLAHVFFRCPVARALWFACCWGFRADEVLINSNQDIIKMVLEPPSTLCQNNDKWIIYLIMSFILEEIWCTRNYVLQNGGSADISSSV